MHEEYKRIVPHSDKAILLIHGIVGTPNHFRAFVPLVPEDISVYNILLDGHGKGVKDFAETSMKKWEAQVHRAIDDLAKDHREIYITAHSLGTLLAIEQAVHDTRVSGLFLLAVPLKLCLKPRMFTTSLRVYLDRIGPEDAQALAAKQCCGVTHHKNPLLYLGWLPRFFELFRKIKETRPLIKAIAVPCLAYQSAKDEMVSVHSSAILRQNPGISVVELSGSGHFYYTPQDLTLLKNAFIDFIS
ncbi:MAG: alpha/beta fold hydrolase [Oscillospiraceae bacterium]|nr:alpha/beta fold hydrolase [Oscillospiraceae bacterium]